MVRRSRRGGPRRSAAIRGWWTPIWARSSCLLTLEGVDAFYGDLQALHGVNLEVRAGELVALVGANAAGKTTTLRVISGTLATRGGRVLFEGQDLSRTSAHARVARGIVQVPEGRRLFPFMTVHENLLLGAHAPEARAAQARSLDYVLGLFPVLGGRALMARPRLLMLDEPTLGIAPVLVQRIFETVAAINRDGVTVLLVEQNVRRALTLAHRGVALENGRVVLAGPARELLADERLKKAYLGL